jgi:hypothetical protein
MRWEGVMTQRATILKVLASLCEISSSLCEIKEDKEDNLSDAQGQLDGAIDALRRMVPPNKKQRRR